MCMMSIFERYKKAIGRIKKPVKSMDARSTDVKMPFGNDESVTHGKFFGENIARVKEYCNNQLRYSKSQSENHQCSKYSKNGTLTDEQLSGYYLGRAESHQAMLNFLKSEDQLIQIAQDAELDSDANAAMKELRERFSSDYIWCEDCDGLVTKLSECCLTRIENEKGNTSGTNCIF